jgi:hypothetical protein
MKENDFPCIGDTKIDGLTDEEAMDALAKEIENAIPTLGDLPLTGEPYALTPKQLAAALRNRTESGLKWLKVRRLMEATEKKIMEGGFYNK